MTSSASSSQLTQIQRTPIAFDRSRVDDDQTCPRLRFLRYELGGTGITKPGEWLDPLIGAAVHTGVETLLSPSVHSLVNQRVDIAVADTVETILDAQRRGPILVYKQSLDMARDIEEACYLAEALLRGWAAIRLPAIEANWEIVSIELEREAYFYCLGRWLKLMTRDDILHRRRDGGLFIRNLKTSSRVDQRFRDKWRYDMQTLSEALAVEQSTNLKVDGVIIEGLVKGSREDFERDINQWTGPGKFHWQSPLLWAWKREGEPPMTDDTWYSRYAWTCTEAHPVARGKMCPGNVGHKLSGVQKAPTWTYPGGIRGWIDHLARNDRELLEAQFIELPAILRSEYEVERWKRMVLPREVEVREHRDQINSYGPIELLSEDDAAVVTQLTDRYFPIHTQDGNCVFPSKCECFEICHGVEGHDLAGAGWIPRRPNHPQENINGR